MLQLHHPVLEGVQLLLDVVLLLAAVGVGSLALLLQGQDLGEELLLQLLHLSVEGIPGKSRGGRHRAIGAGWQLLLHSAVATTGEERREKRETSAWCHCRRLSKDMPSPHHRGEC